MRISDWSSDVCSSDLDAGQALQARALVERTHEEVEQPGAHDAALAPGAEGTFGVDVETRAGQQLVALGVGLHQAVLDAVVDHLGEVPGARRTGVDRQSVV